MLPLLRPVTWATSTSPRLPGAAEQGPTTPPDEPNALADLTRDEQGPRSPISGGTPLPIGPRSGDCRGDFRRRDPCHRVLPDRLWWASAKVGRARSHWTGP